MKVRKSEYAIIKAGGKFLLIRCSSEDGNSYTGVLQGKKKKSDDAPEELKFSSRDVACCLGKAPAFGSAFGVKIEPLVKIEPHQYWGEVHTYVRLDEGQTAEVGSELKKFRAALKEKRVSGVKPILELRNPSGKMAGMYKYRPREEQDVMIIRVQEDLAEFQYVLAHEYGHGVWFRMMQRATRLKWIKLFHAYITMLEADESDLDHLLDEVQSQQSVSSAQKSLEEHDQILLKECLRNVHRIHGLSKMHLEMMLEAGDSIEEYWPQSIELSEKEIALTDYARKAPEELFAESFAFWFIGRKLPKRIQALMDTTLSRLIRT